MKRAKLAIFGAFFGVFGAFLPVSGAEPEPSAQQIAARLTANQLRADVAFLASDALQGRGTPSPGLDAAAEFVASQFRRAGLEPAGDDGYFQTAPFANVTPNFEGLQLTLTIGGRGVAAEQASMGLQQPAAVEVKDAAVVLASLADAAAVDALTAEQVKGKVLILDATTAGGGRGGAFAVARRAPALAAKLRPLLLILLRADGLGIGTNARLRDESSVAVPILAVWDKGVRDALKDATAGTVDASVTAHIAAPKVEAVKLRNVVGVLRGSDPVLRDTYLLITAHYDHLGVRGSGPDTIFNGANDDASGTASVMEIAGTLAGLPRQPKRSLVFVALFGEELGLVGSRYYAQHPVFPLAKTVADLNLEQLGRTDDVTGPRVGIVNATGFDYTDMTTVLAKAGEDFGVQVLKDEASSDAFFGRSDNQAFADAGIPSHTLSVGYVFPDYHQAGDHWTKIDYDNMAKVGCTVALAVYRMADSVEAPQWNAENSKTEPYRKAR